MGTSGRRSPGWPVRAGVARTLTQARTGGRSLSPGTQRSAAEEVGVRGRPLRWSDLYVMHFLMVPRISPKYPEGSPRCIQGVMLSVWKLMPSHLKKPCSLPEGVRFGCGMAWEFSTSGTVRRASSHPRSLCIQETAWTVVGSQRQCVVERNRSPKFIVLQQKCYLPHQHTPLTAAS